MKIKYLLIIVNLFAVKGFFLKEVAEHFRKTFLTTSVLKNNLSKAKWFVIACNDLAIFLLTFSASTLSEKLFLLNWG